MGNNMFGGKTIAIQSYSERRYAIFLCQINELKGYPLGVLPLHEVHCPVSIVTGLWERPNLRKVHMFLSGVGGQNGQWLLFFWPLSPSQSAIMALKIAARHIEYIRMGTFGTVLPRSESFPREQIKGCNVHATCPTVPLHTGNWIRDVFLLFSLSQLSPRTVLNWSKTTIWINGGVPSFHL